MKCFEFDFRANILTDFFLALKTCNLCPGRHCSRIISTHSTKHINSTFSLSVIRIHMNIVCKMPSLKSICKKNRNDQSCRKTGNESATRAANDSLFFCLVANAIQMSEQKLIRCSESKNSTLPLRFFPAFSSSVFLCRLGSVVRPTTAISFAVRSCVQNRVALHFSACCAYRTDFARVRSEVSPRRMLLVERQESENNRIHASFGSFYEKASSFISLYLSTKYE